MVYPRIVQLHLHHFRNYDQLAIACDANLVVLTGSNGAGKTNLLEAISMLSVGRGFRNASAAEQHQHHADASQWIIRATLAKDAQQQVQLATAHEKGQSKRLIRVDGEPLSSQQGLLDYLHIIWFLPSMSHLFQEGMSVRRKYFDRIVYGFDREHASRIHAYEHYMRERGKVLQMPHTDIRWLSSLEQKMAEYSVAIAFARLDMVKRMNHASTTLHHSFPFATIQLVGEVETWLEQGLTALEAEQALLEALQQCRIHDRQSGRSSHGAHKSRVDVHFMPNHIPAELCSTGEQKALLLSLMMAQLAAHQQWSSTRPIILLDEMVAHLDASRREALFNALAETGGQVFATGTDASDFSAFAQQDVLSITIRQGKVQHVS